MICHDCIHSKECKAHNLIWTHKDLKDKIVNIDGCSWYEQVNCSTCKNKCM